MIKVKKIENQPEIDPYKSIYYSLVSGMAAQGVLLPERIVEDSKKLNISPDKRVSQLAQHIYGLAKVMKKKLDGVKE